MPDAPPLQIGLAGFGTVGAGVYQNLLKNRDLLQKRIGRSLEVKRVVVRDPGKPRETPLPEGLVSADLASLAADESIDVVVELIGGTGQAFDLIKAALERGKTVVTGNKALLAERGQELFDIARRAGAAIYFEAAVAGGIPIIKTVQESLVGNHIESLAGIINGTSNYILTRMAEAGLDYADALAEAQQLGYAEADPALDVNGWDAGHKAIILAALSYGCWVPPSLAHVEGIEGVTRKDIEFAGRFGYAVKLLAVIRLHPESSAIELRVQPSLLPRSHILASVNGVHNAILIRGDVVGETLFYGSGAGRDPTSSSVISDLADAALWRHAAEGQSGFVPHELYGQPLPVEESVSKYYLRVEADDQPGVLAQIAKALGDHGIGILSVIQPEDHEEGSAPIVLMLHYARYGDVKQALVAVGALDCVREQPVLMRVETL